VADDNGYLFRHIGAPGTGRGGVVDLATSPMISAWGRKPA
jgi:hypothetical protein